MSDNLIGNTEGPGNAKQRYLEWDENEESYVMNSKELYDIEHTIFESGGTRILTDWKAVHRLLVEQDNWMDTVGPKSRFYSKIVEPYNAEVRVTHHGELYLSVYKNEDREEYNITGEIPEQYIDDFDARLRGERRGLLLTSDPFSKHLEHLNI